MRRRLLRSCAAGLLLALVPAAGAAPEEPAPWREDVRRLLDGVREIASPGVPGTVAVWGPAAFPVVLGGRGAVLRSPVVAAARWGRGRVVAFGHDGYGDPRTAEVADTSRFLRNALAWAAGGGGTPRVGVRRSGLGRWLAEQGLPAVPLADDGWTSRLGDLDVVLLFGGDLPPREREAVAGYVARGGGLLVGQTGWGWLQVRRREDFAENDLQALLAPAGIGWTAATAERTGPRGLLAADVPGTVLHAARAVEALARARDGRAGGDRGLRLAAHVATEAWPVLPPGDSEVRRAVGRLARQRARDAVPTPASPLRPDRPLERFLLAVEVADLARAAPADVRPHPAAEAFPGGVPAAARATARRVPVDLGVPGWHGTGLYAVPGRVVTVRAAPAEGGAAPEGLAFRIGCHADALWHLDAWPRVPEVTLERPLSGGALAAASAFGGPCYVVVPEGAGGRAVVEIEGAVEAPRYVLGATTAEAWRAARRAPGPWAELETSKVVLTVPSEHVRDLEDPAPLLRWWDRVLDAAADLAAWPRERRRPERYVADIEISAGYMHSGYPIMTHLDAAPRMVDLALLSRRGDWGLFHELGHNHQSPDWTFEGTGEVTCNWFSLYLFATVVGEEGFAGHGALAERERRTREHRAAGAPFDAWKADPFLALFAYVDLLEAFGWDALKDVVAEYRRLPEAERPRSDDAKRDQWLQRYSRRVGRNLGPFFEAWGIPTSEAARASVADLPPWPP